MAIRLDLDLYKKEVKLIFLDKLYYLYALLISMTEMHNIYPCLKVGHQVGLGLGGRGGVPALVQSRAVHTGPVARVVKIKNLILWEKNPLL